MSNLAHQQRARAAESKDRPARKAILARLALLGRQVHRGRAVLQVCLDRQAQLVQVVLAANAAFRVLMVQQGLSAKRDLLALQVQPE